MLRSVSARSIGRSQGVAFKNASQGNLEVSAKRHASGKQIQDRIKAIGNISKITKAMKLVASARLRKSQDNVALSRAFANPVVNLWTEPNPEEVKEAPATLAIIPFTSDKGLCGGVNSSIIRDVKSRFVKDAAELKDAKLIVFGEKGRTGLQRVQGERFLGAVSQSKIKKLTFEQACQYADVILKAKIDKSLLLFNYFRSVISYETTATPVYGFDYLSKDQKTLSKYEQEGEADMLENFYEFRLACQMYNVMAETEVSELSSRMNAMENSSKNASDVLSKLRLTYNRTRQFKITTELIEIISGSAALDDAKK